MKTILIFVIAAVLAQNVLGDIRRQCSMREKFERCGTACPITCANYNRPPSACPERCVPGCFCMSPYIRNEDGGGCVLPSECKAKGYVEPQPSLNGSCNGRRETYNNCGSLCPRTCANRNQRRIPCATGCQRGCFCERGFLRNSRNRCVPIENCD